MTDFCTDPAGPFRLTLRGARQTVFDRRADLWACLDAMSEEDRKAVVVESAETPWNSDTGDYVWDALRASCGDEGGEAS